MCPGWTGKILQELNKTQLTYCYIFKDSWEVTALLALRADSKDQIWSAVNLSKLLVMRNHRLEVETNQGRPSLQGLALCYNFIECRDK